MERFYFTSEFVVKRFEMLERDVGEGRWKAVFGAVPRRGFLLPSRSCEPCGPAPEAEPHGTYLSTYCFGTISTVHRHGLSIFQKILGRGP